MDAQIAAGKAFYDEKLATGDYIEHPEKFLYRFLKADGSATGPGESNNASPKPGPTDKVTVHYEGKLINGTVFDSSYERNETIKFGLDQVIPGWGLAVQQMSYGDKIECILPYTLAYGEQGAGGEIPGGATLIFIIEYFETIVPPAVAEGKAYMEEQRATGEYSEHKGMLYKWLVAPTDADAEKPKVTDEVTVHYEGKLINGTVFDSSVKRGETSSFGLRRVIRGWTEIMQIMTVGSKLRVIIPCDLAYGDESDKGAHIKAGSTLIFEIELFSFKPAPAEPECSIM